MIDTAAIEAGRAAWQRIQERNSKAWPDWVSVGHALIAGRSAVMQAANTNRPFGLIYTRKMAEWLEQNGFNTINPQERYRSICCVENLPAIEEWRSSLDAKMQQRLNHPNAVWYAWKRATKTIPAMPNAEGFGRSSKEQKPEVARQIHWDGDAIKRAAMAIREAYSTDFYVMARRALEAAIRNETDLMALLPRNSRRAA